MDVTGIEPVPPGNKQSSVVSGLPSLQNLERRAFPEDSGNNNVSIEDCLDRHFARRLTLAIADFKSAFFTPAFLASARARLKSSWYSSSLGGVMTLRITASPWPMTTNWSPSLSPRSLRTSSGMTTCPLHQAGTAQFNAVIRVWNHWTGWNSWRKSAPAF